MEHSIHHQSKSKKFKKIGLWVFLGILAAIAFAIVLGFGVMYLWNWLMPAIFGLATITYWQAVGLFVLAKLFFGGFGNHKHGKRDHRFHRKFKHKFSKENTSKWKYYDRFWKEKGEQVFEEYLEQLKNEKNAE